MRRLYVPLHPAAFFNCLGSTLFICLAAVSSCPLPQTCKGKPAQAHDATGSAKGEFAQHRFGVRMRYRRENPTITGWCKLRIEPARTFGMPMSFTAFHAHYVLLYISRSSMRCVYCEHLHPAAFCTTERNIVLAYDYCNTHNNN